MLPLRNFGLRFLLCKLVPVLTAAAAAAMVMTMMITESTAVWSQLAALSDALSACL